MLYVNAAKAWLFSDLGECGRGRTDDQLIKNQLLFQLSYTLVVGEGGRGRTDDQSIKNQLLFLLSYTLFLFWPAFRGLVLLFHLVLLPCAGGGRWIRTTPPEGNRFTACRRALQLIDHRTRDPRNAESRLRFPGAASCSGLICLHICRP